MRLLLDTHTYYWWATESGDLSKEAAEALFAPGAELLLSAVVPWELATKHRRGKWPGAKAALDDLGRAIEAQRLRPLPITLEHARRSGLIVSPHNDPFDRMLAAQAAMEGVPIVTVDRAFRDLGCEVLW